MQLTSMMVRALKGAPITVLVLMMINRQPVSLGYISRHSGYSDKVVHDCIELLNDFGLVTKTGRYTWQIADGIEQLPLMANQLEDGIEDTDLEDVTEVIDVEPQKKARSESFRPNPLASSRSINQNLEIDPLLPESRTPSSENIRANLEKLDHHHIREPARTRLAGLAHVTPELIEYHCATAPNNGAAIYRIEHGWPIKPRAQDSGDRSKYVNGQFKNFIEH